MYKNWTTAVTISSCLNLIDAIGMAYGLLMCGLCDK